MTETAYSGVDPSAQGIEAMRVIGGCLAQRVKHRTEGSDPSDVDMLPRLDHNIEAARAATREMVGSLSSLARTIAGIISEEPFMPAAALGAKLAVRGAEVSENGTVTPGVSWYALMSSSDFARVRA